MNIDVMFSSNDMTWETPLELFNELNEEFHFNTDVCAVPETAKCKEYYTPEIDGLKQKWHGVCWMNPPYGKDIGKWMEKAYMESLNGVIVVCLIPARTDTKYWHNYCFKASEIRFIKGRLRFGNSNNSAPFPSAIVIFNNNVSNNIIKPVDYRNISLTPTEYGIGYLGYITLDDYNIHAYTIWKEMLEKQYNLYRLFNYNINIIIPRWLCFQLFYQDIFYLNGFDEELYLQDKLYIDNWQPYLSELNRVYSPTSCILKVKNNKKDVIFKL